MHSGHIDIVGYILDKNFSPGANISLVVQYDLKAEQHHIITFLLHMLLLVLLSVKCQKQLLFHTTKFSIPKVESVILSAREDSHSLHSMVIVMLYLHWWHFVVSGADVRCMLNWRSSQHLHMYQISVFGTPAPIWDIIAQLWQIQHLNQSKMLPFIVT